MWINFLFYRDKILSICQAAPQSWSKYTTDEQSQSYLLRIQLTIIPLFLDVITQAQAPHCNCDCLPKISCHKYHFFNQLYTLFRGAFESITDVIWVRFQGVRLLGLRFLTSDGLMLPSFFVTFIFQQPSFLMIKLQQDNGDYLHFLLPSFLW